MLKRLTVFGTLMILLLSSGLSVAQQSTATPTPSTTTSDSTVTIFIVICDTKAVVNFSGNMQAGYDIYYQIFAAPGATGNPLTSLRRVSVSGSYSFSEAVTYDQSATVAAGNTASAKVVIAVEGAPSNTIYDTTVNDFQDGCSEPKFQTGSSTDTGGGSTTTTTASGPLIRSPFGGYINPNYDPQSPAAVVIGARDTAIPRQKTPGVIFAECDAYPRAYPGLVYDTDTVVVFWSWYAKTPELVQQHIDNAIYEVGVFGSNPFVQPVIVSDIEQRGANYWVFYTVTLGNVKPGTYPIGFRLTWKQAINDGYNDFGPDTGKEEYTNTCTFTVSPNPDGKAVSYNFP